MTTLSNTGTSLLTNSPWKRVVEVTPMAEWKLSVTLHNGEQLLLDIATLIHSKDAYWRLRQERYFRQVGIDPLGALCWPEGEDIAPEALERYNCN